LDKNIIHVYSDRPKDTFDVIISFSYKCNRSCVYCTWHQDDDIPTYSEMVDLLENIIKSVDHKKINFLIHGGEPTIIPDLPSVVMYIVGKYDHVSFNIQSNMSNDIEWFMKFVGMESNIRFTCSYQHHQNNDFSDYLRKVEWINENGLLHAIDFILEPMNELEIIDIIRNIAKLPLSNKVVYTYVDMIHNDKYNIISDIIDNNKKDTECVYVRYKNGDIKYYYNTLDLKMEKNDNFRFFYCSAGNSQIYVEPNGDVYRCITDRYTKNPRCNAYNFEELSLYIKGKPKPCIFKECICELWVEKVRVGYEDKIE
jgi:sulfatase maturation enzyme AslB (radical SAM superfamily)